MPAAAIPIIMAATTATSAGTGIYAAHKAGQAQDASMASTAQADKLAGEEGQRSASLFRQGMPQLQQAGNYFSTLAGGNRAATTQALAPDIEGIQSIYGGTARTLSRFLRGPEKDTQMAELERQRAGQIGSLFRGARPQANANLASLGGSAVTAGQQGTQGAAGIFGQSAQLSQQAGQFASKQSEQAGADFGGLLFQLLKQYGGGKSSSTPTGAGYFQSGQVYPGPSQGA